MAQPWAAQWFDPPSGPGVTTVCCCSDDPPPPGWLVQCHEPALAWVFSGLWLPSLLLVLVIVAVFAVILPRYSPGNGVHHGD